MTFTQSIRTCFSKYATFSGRASRPEYWCFFLFVLAGGMVLSLLDGLVFGFGTADEPPTRIFAPVFQLATLLPLLGAGWRRMHDTGRPGWLLLLPLLVALGGLLLSILGVVGFAGLESTGALDEADLRGTALWMGGAGFYLVGIVQFVATLLLVWWLTRPGETGPNAHGPAPGTVTP